MLLVSSLSVSRGLHIIFRANIDVIFKKVVELSVVMLTELHGVDFRLIFRHLKTCEDVTNRKNSLKSVKIEIND